jgi:hypothetical protein
MERRITSHHIDAGQGMPKHGMLASTVAPLAAVLALTAAVPEIAAGAKNNGVPCEERSFVPDDPTLRTARAIGGGNIRVLGGTAAIVPGQALLLGASRPGGVCALFANGLEARAGWVPQGRIGPATPLVDPAPPLAAWVGTWRQYDNKIVLTPVGDRLSANGEAYWPGKSIMPANEGAFSGTTTPSGRRLHFAAESSVPCLVDLVLAGEFLFADDNRMCGGHNVAFSGVFIRPPKRTK